MFIKQSTLKKTILIYGTSIHSKKKVKLKLKPSRENFGIIFRRIDLQEYIDIPVLITNIIDTKLSTIIGKNTVYIKTIEHLLSAIFILGIDNMLIEINSEEMPIMDGSAYSFIFLLTSSGIKYLHKYKRFLRVKKEVSLEDPARLILLLPSENLNIYFSLKKKYYIFSFNIYNYVHSISKARTFGFSKNYIDLLSHNLSKGARFNNVLIFHNNQFFNKNLLRYNNEDIRHKLLDFLGDVSLLGKFILSSFWGVMPGHFFNNNMLHHLLYNPHYYDLISFHKYDGFIKR